MVAMYLRYILIVLLTCLLIIPAKGQDSFNTFGGDASGNGGTVAYTIGQLVYTTQVGTNWISEQGVQHAYSISTSGIFDSSLAIFLTAFPNPVEDQLTLQINDYSYDKLSYQLIDMQGKLLNSGQITAQQTHINISSLPTATYCLNVLNLKNINLRTFLIIKK